MTRLYPNPCCNIITGCVIKGLHCNCSDKDFQVGPTLPYYLFVLLSTHVFEFCTQKVHSRVYYINTSHFSLLFYRKALKSLCTFISNE